MNFIDAYLDETVGAFIELKSNSQNHQVLQEMSDTIVHSLRNGGKLLICGNGGSAGDAQHIAGVPGEVVDHLTARDRPQFDRFIERARRQRCAVRGERHPNHCIAVPYQRFVDGAILDLVVQYVGVVSVVPLALEEVVKPLPKAVQAMEVMENIQNHYIATSMGILFRISL